MFVSSEPSTASLSATVAQSAADEKVQTEDEELTAVKIEENEEQEMEVDGSDWILFSCP